MAALRVCFAVSTEFTFCSRSDASSGKKLVDADLSTGGPCVIIAQGDRVYYMQNRVVAGEHGPAMLVDLESGWLAHPGWIGWSLMRRQRMSPHIALAHKMRRDSKETRAVFPVLIGLRGEFDVGFMQQRRGLQRIGLRVRGAGSWRPAVAIRHKRLGSGSQELRDPRRAIVGAIL